MVRPTLKERQHQLRTEAILDAAHNLLSHLGYEAMSVDALAAEVGISKATLYHHFPSKEELAVSVAVRQLQQAEERMRTVDPALPAIERLEIIMRRGLERRAALWATGVNPLPVNLCQHPRYQEQHQRLMSIIVRLIETAKAEGAIAPELATPVIARTLFQLFQTNYVDLLEQGRCSPQDLSNTLVTMIFEGLRSREH